MGEVVYLCGKIDEVFIVFENVWMCLEFLLKV